MKNVDTHHLAKLAAQLYDPRANIDEVVDELFNPDAVAQDPVAKVTGIKNIKAQFKLFKPFLKKTEAKVVNQGFLEDNLLCVESDLLFFWVGVPSFLHTKLHIVTLLGLDKNNHKVNDFQALWDIRSMIQGIPVVSFFYDKFRVINGSVSSCFVNTLSIGKWKAQVKARETAEYAKTTMSKAAEGMSGMMGTSPEGIQEKFTDAKSYAQQQMGHAKEVSKEKFDEGADKMHSKQRDITNGRH